MDKRTHNGGRAEVASIIGSIIDKHEPWAFPLIVSGSELTESEFVQIARRFGSKLKDYRSQNNHDALARLILFLSVIKVSDFTQIIALASGQHGSGVIRGIREGVLLIDAGKAELSEYNTRACNLIVLERLQLVIRAESYKSLLGKGATMLVEQILAQMAERVEQGVA